VRLVQSHGRRGIRGKRKGERDVERSRAPRGLVDRLGQEAEEGQGGYMFSVVHRVFTLY